jgi:spore coat protein U-like protein
MRTRLVSALLAPCLALAFAPAARAGCTLTGGNLAFGNISQTSDTFSQTTLNLNCNFTATTGMARICIGFGSPTSGDVDNRKMMLAAGQDLLAYNLYTSSSYTTIWGSYAGPTFPPPLDFVLTGGTLSTNIVLYGKVPAGQGRLPAGSWSDIYPPSAIQVGWLTYPSTVQPTGCPNIPIDSSITLTNFKVQAGTNAPKATCSVSASAIDFGQRGALNAAVNVNGTVTVNCVNNTPYSLSMDRGRGTGASVLNRLMTRNGGTETIKYNLYSDPAYSTVWGDGTGGSTVSGMGTGQSFSHMVYGRMPAQSPTPPPGGYSDTITVTITY